MNTILIKRSITWVVIVAMITAMLPATVLGAASPQKSAQSYYGDLELTLSLDYPISYQKMDTAGIQITLQQASKDIVTVPLEAKPAHTQSFQLDNQSYQVSVEPRNEAGLEMSSEEIVSYYKLNFMQLPAGNYQVKLTGNGYTEYISDPIEMNDYAKHIVIGTTNGTFAAGDVDHNNKVTKEDMKAVEQLIAKPQQDAADLASADLNKDGKIDVTDLAYIYFNIGVEGKAKIADTKRIRVDFNQAEMDQELEKIGLTSKDIETMLDPKSEETVQLQSASGNAISVEEPIQLPLIFAKPVEMEQIKLETPLAGNAPTTGEAVVIYEENGQEHALDPIPFNATEPVGIHYLTRNTDRHVVEINLGKKVAVKRITINITGTTNPNSTFADVAKVEFIKDIVPDNPQSTTGIIKGFAATAQSESVELSWNHAPNVTGYKVSYGTESGKYTEEIVTEKNKLSVKGLKNFQPYYFVVRATNGSWAGPVSNELSATPVPASKPEAPSGMTITPDDGRLMITWNTVKTATHYHVYYRQQQEETYKKIANLQAASYNLTGLTNDVKYEVYVTASNEVGESGPSDIQIATPTKEMIIEPKVPTVNRIDNSHIKDIRLANKNNVVSSIYPNGYNPQNVVDGDYSTHWTARAWWEDPAHIVTFDQAYEMDYVVYVPRLDGKYKESLGSYSITVWGPEDDLSGPGKSYFWKKRIPSYNSKDGYAVLPFPKTNVKQIKVGVHIWDGARTESTASELMFYNYYSINDDIRALFANDAYTKIADGVTQAQIDNLRQVVNGEQGHYFVEKSILLGELAMAEALLNGDATKLGKVLPIVQGRVASENGNRGFSYTMNDFQPLGISAKAGNQIVLYVSADGEEMPELVATQYFPDWNRWKAAPIALQKGRNVIEIPQIGTTNTERGGSLYLTYRGKAKDAEIHVKGGTVIPMLSVPDLKQADEQSIKQRIQQYIETLTPYVKKLSNGDRTLQVLNSTEIETADVLLSLPASKVLEGIQAGGLTMPQQVERVYQSLLAWEQVIDIQYRVHGLSKDAVEPQNSWPTARINIRYTRMSNGAFMYAAGAHIGIGFGSASGLIQGKPTAVQASPNALFGWGISHEIGHVIDQRERVYGETTNNIYSLFVQTYDGQDNIGQSRLELSDKYKDIYTKVSRPAPGRASDVFVSLGMFWQLHLAYDGAGDESFNLYNKLHQNYRDKAYRNILPAGLNADNLFAVIASDTVGKDLTPFFERWGFVIDPQVDEYLSGKGYPVEDRALYYLNDEARRYRLAGKTGMAADIQMTVDVASLPNSKEVELHIKNNADAEDILGYEIYRNGQSIAFTTDKTYVDVIGAPNNQSFSYEVVAYDKLLNASTKVKAAKDVKISHDGSLPKDSWTYKLNQQNEIVINLGSVQQTAGIKFNEIPTFLDPAKAGVVDAVYSDGGVTDAVYDYKVEVSLDGVVWTQAKGGMFNQSDATVVGSDGSTSYVSYFNKPNTAASDTRIWTYDARYVRISGSDRIEAMKSNVSSAIDIVSYPGDNIEISPGAIGYLLEDFIYMGTEGEEIIPKGTLIVTGNYRGDPVYNAIALKGLYNAKGQFGEDDTLEERFIGGYGLMFAEIPEDGAVSETSDGFWLFVPDVPESLEQLADKADEEESFPEMGHAAAILPSQIKAELYRSLTPDDLTNSLKVSDTIWITSPDEQTMPYLSLKGDRR